MKNTSSTNKKVNSTEHQYSTFYVADRLYGIDVTKVQEIVRPMPITSIPLAPDYVRGLINLRGQVATAIGLRELFGITEDPPSDFMNVVCKIDGSLISLHVDQIADVMYVKEENFETTPQTIPPKVRQFMDGVYKTENNLLSVINIDRIMENLNANASTEKSHKAA